MADYQLATSDPNGPVLRTVDQAFIPADPGNRDWIDYQDWLSKGNVPDAFVPPPEPKPETTQEQQNAVLLDHENRIRALAGDPPLTADDFDKVLKPK